MARWYIIHAYSGFEGKVRDSIMAEATRMGLEQLVEQIEVPTETTTEARRGKKIAVERKFMPGYVLAKLNMNDDVYHLVKNTPKVTGFLGSMGKPQAISEAEATRMLNSKEEAAAAPKQKVKVDYEIGDQVKVLDGPFATFNGLSKNSTSTAAASRFRCRSSGVRRLWSSSSSRSKEASKAKPHAISPRLIARRHQPGRRANGPADDAGFTPASRLGG